MAQQAANSAFVMVDASPSNDESSVKNVRSASSAAASGCCHATICAASGEVTKSGGCHAPCWAVTTWDAGA